MELADLSESLRWEIRSIGLEFQQHLRDGQDSDQWKKHFVIVENKLQSLEQYEASYADEVVKLHEYVEDLKLKFSQIDKEITNHKQADVDHETQVVINKAMEQSYMLSLLQSDVAKANHRRLSYILIGPLLLILVIKTVIIVLLNRSINQDVRDLRELEGNLSRSNEELSRFVYFISHDLREPARMVACYMKMLQEKDLDADVAELVRFGVEGAARMEALLDSLLAYTRLDSEIEKQDVEFCRDVVEIALRDLRSTIDASGAKVTFTCDNPDPSHCWHCKVSCDPVLMCQVLVNLIGNSIKYAKSDVPPVIRIIADRNEDEWTFCISDNGIGIESADINENLFKLFKRLHTRDQYPGCGIGLASCKKVISRHGGRIWVESQVGVGSQFHFTLPV
jgi:signal transduction histidine kinase